MCKLCRFRGHEDAHACNALFVYCCCLPAVCLSLFFRLCVFDKCGLKLLAMCTCYWHVDARACEALLVDCCSVSVV